MPTVELVNATAFVCAPGQSVWLGTMSTVGVGFTVTTADPEPVLLVQLASVTLTMVYVPAPTVPIGMVMVFVAEGMVWLPSGVETTTVQGPVPVSVPVMFTVLVLPAQSAPPPLITAVGLALMVTVAVAEAAGQLPEAAMVFVTV